MRVEWCQWQNVLLWEIRCWNWIYYFLFEYIAWHLYTWSDVRNGIKILRKGFANIGRCDGMRQSQIWLNRLKLNHGCVLCINFLYFVITEMPWIYRISVYLRWKIFFCTMAIRRRFTVIFCANYTDVGVLYHHIVIFALDSTSMQSSSFFFFERLPNANFKFIILANTRLWDKQTYISSDSTSSAGWKSDVCYKTFVFVRRKVIVLVKIKRFVSWMNSRLNQLVFLITCSLHLNNRPNQ